MREIGVTFTTDSVRAIIAGRKTQTRRVVQPGENRKWLSAKTIHDAVRRFEHRKDGYWGMAVGEPRRIMHCGVEIDGGHIGSVRCPYGQPGDRIWVREPLVRWADDGIVPLALYDAGRDVVRGNTFLVEWKWRNASLPARYMPRACARIMLEVTEIRVERVNKISNYDVGAEGVELKPFYTFRDHWDAINDKRGYGWDVNPWVWVVSFQVIDTTGGNLWR